MQAAKEKLSNMASAAKERACIYKAKAEEKVEKAAARTKEEKEIARERRKAKEAQAKMELHQEKAKHKEERLNAEPHTHHHVENVPVPAASVYDNQHVHRPILGTAAPSTGINKTTALTYPLAKDPPAANGNYI
ncbi:PREDICTED: uncharacterized protein LOC104606491 [Nelumbo nucifera]|uniref:Uncharacterized protein n=2 Tax=Nelumbo nucifera TaxID=4432 RepID=A0A822ZRK6_NELNU|nr:PREDICTED: uncharacterized protein LOC104606491 [Nelumbo nucifera]DAD47517.1 TPA_asm: hypothetical protein HUJ06_017454 [Nelumbo nucifera]